MDDERHVISRAQAGRTKPCAVRYRYIDVGICMADQAQA